MSVRQRCLLTLAIVLTILFAVALLGYVSGRWGEGAQAQSVPLIYEGIPLDATLLALDKRALDEAYHAQLVKLFGVWLSSQAGDTTNFRNGLRIARRAYGQAASQIAKREQELLQQQQQQRP